MLRSTRTQRMTIIAEKKKYHHIMLYSLTQIKI